MCTRAIIRAVNLCYDVYYYIYNNIYYQPEPKLNDRNVQILGATINNSNDITMNTVQVVRVIGDKLITVAYLIDEKCHPTFDTLEVMILLHGQLINHTYTKLDEYVHFHYGLEWMEYLATTSTRKNLEYLDLIST